MQNLLYLDFHPVQVLSRKKMTLTTIFQRIIASGKISASERDLLLERITLQSYISAEEHEKVQEILRRLQNGLVKYVD